jgi:hypothetical protein
MLYNGARRQAMIDMNYYEMIGGGPMDGLLYELFAGTETIGFPTIIGGEHIYRVVPGTYTAKYAGLIPFAKEQHHDD